MAVSERLVGEVSRGPGLLREQLNSKYRYTEDSKRSSSSLAGEGSEG